MSVWICGHAGSLNSPVAVWGILFPYDCGTEKYYLEQV